MNETERLILEGLSILFKKLNNEGFKIVEDRESIWTFHVTELLSPPREDLEKQRDKDLGEKQ